MKSGESDEHVRSVGSFTGIRSLGKIRHSRDSDSDSLKTAPKNADDVHGHSHHAENEVDNRYLSLSDAEEFIDDAALEQRWQQMLDDDELMEAEDLSLKLDAKVNSYANPKDIQTSRISEAWSASGRHGKRGRRHACVPS